MAFAFEKLQDYQESVDFADQIASLSENFPGSYGFLADQLNRASLSIAANLAEGNRRFTKADRKHFFAIARGSVQECVAPLELTRRRKLISDGEHIELKAQLEVIAKMVSGLIAGFEKRTTKAEPAVRPARTRRQRPAHAVQTSGSHLKSLRTPDF